MVLNRIPKTFAILGELEELRKRECETFSVNSVLEGLL